MMTIICLKRIICLILIEQYDTEKDNDLVTDEPDYKPETRECIFSKGQSKRIWNELHKVVDSSDVIIQVRRMREYE